MEMKAVSIALILLGVAFLTLAASQMNSMVVSNAQSELAKPVAEAQIIASEELAKSYGQTDAEIAASSKEARDLLNKTIVTMNNSYWLTSIADFIFGLVFILLGIFTYPKGH